MAKKKDEEKKINNIDDFFEDLRKKKVEKLDDAFKHYDEFTDEDNIDHYLNNMFHPAQDDLYKGVTDQLAKDFENDKASTHNKKKELRKAVVEGLKKYFDKVKPSVTDVIEGDWSEDDVYDFLTQMYDDHIGAGKIRGVESIRTVEDFAKDKKGKIGRVKKHLYIQKTKHADAALKTLASKATTHFFGTYHPTEIAAHLKPHIEKAGLEIEDRVRYALHETPELIGLRQGIRKGHWPEGKTHEHYGLKYKDNKKK